MGEILNYKKFVITQRINELVKALKRVPVDENPDSYYSMRKQELENLKKDLDNS